MIAPVRKGTKVGDVTIYYDNNKILTIKILTTEEVKKKGILDYIFEISKNYGNYLKALIWAIS